MISISIPSDDKKVILATANMLLYLADLPQVQPPPSPSLELDSTGAPWDAAKHAASRGQTKNGEWRTTRIKPVPPPPSYSDILAIASWLIKSGKISIEQINSACQRVGAADLKELGALDRNLVATVLQEIKSICQITQ